MEHKENDVNEHLLHVKETVWEAYRDDAGLQSYPNETPKAHLFIKQERDIQELMLTYLREAGDPSDTTEHERELCLVTFEPGLMDADDKPYPMRRTDLYWIAVLPNAHLALANIEEPRFTHFVNMINTRYSPLQWFRRYARVKPLHEPNEHSDAAWLLNRLHGEYTSELFFDADHLGIEESRLWNEKASRLQIRITDW